MHLISPMANTATNVMSLRQVWLQPPLVMSFALTLGAFGDFVSAIQLQHQAQQALRSVGGSAMHYQHIINRIGAFQLLLLQAGQLQLKDVSPALKNGLNHHVSQAEEATKVFLSQIGGYHASLSPGGNGSWMRDAWKVTWKLKDGDMREFMERMRDQTIAIGLLLSTANVSVCSQFSIASLSLA